MGRPKLTKQDIQDIRASSAKFKNWSDGKIKRVWNRAYRKAQRQARKDRAEQIKKRSGHG